MRSTLITRALLLVGAIMGATALTTSTATAAEVRSNPTPSSVAELQAQLESQGVSPTIKEHNGVVVKDYVGQTSSGLRVVVETTEPAGESPGQSQIKLHVGVGNGIYYYLNQTDQRAAIAGGTAGLIGLVCSLPGVGQVACASASAALSAAATYLAEHGICSHELEVHYLGFPDPRPSFTCV